MKISIGKKGSIQVRIFWSLLSICILSIGAASALAYISLKNTFKEQNETIFQKKKETMMSLFDYSLSKEKTTANNVGQILKNEIYKNADILKLDVAVYDLKGQYIMANKENLFKANIPNTILRELKGKVIKDLIHTNDQNVNEISSYITINNSSLEPVGILYFPSYYNNALYTDALSKYIKFIVALSLFFVVISSVLSFNLARKISNRISKISDKLLATTLDADPQPLIYNETDELSPLVRAYNRMTHQLGHQKNLLGQIEREKAWREMAKQVAHEVKNPLTPMKLLIQNFHRRFDINDPKITEKVNNLTKNMVDQIDLIATVASAFSEFGKLPEKRDEILNLNQEILQIAHMFQNHNIFVQSLEKDIEIKMDKIYLSRIITNLITNAQQAKQPEKDLVIALVIKSNVKTIKIEIEDNGVGMNQELINKIFAPNFTTKSSGMGLGLSMVRKMIEEYHGAIGVESQEGLGTKFKITLPRTYQSSKV